MSLLPSLKNTTLSLRIPSDVGPMPVKSTSSSLKAITAATSSLTLSKKTSNLQTLPNTSTYGSLLINKNLTFNINSTSSLTSFPITLSSPTSGPVSTLEEKDLKPFWTKSSKTNSQKLWLPVETDSLDLDTNSSRIFSLGIMPRLLSSTVRSENNSRKNCPKTSSASSLTSPQNTQATENIKKQSKTKPITILKKDQTSVQITTRQKVRVQKTMNQKQDPIEIRSLKTNQKNESLKEIQKVQPNNNQKHPIKKSLSKTNHNLNQQNKVSKSKKIPKDDPDDDVDIDIVDDSGTIINSSIVCRKIRIYPTSVQSSFFNKCFGTSRFIYNAGIEYLNNLISSNNLKMKSNVESGCVYLSINEDGDEIQCCEDVDKSNTYFCTDHKSKQNRWNGYKIDTSLATFRKNVLVNDKDLSESEKWQKDVPYDTRQLILKDLIGGFKAATSNKIRGNVKEFKMRYKSRRDATQIFHINKKALTKDLELFKTRKVGKLRVRSKMKKWLENNIKSIESDCKIIRYRGGQYYLLLTMIKNTEQKEIPFDAVALDPGVRTFQTLYSPNGFVGKIGEDFSKNNIIKIAEKIDKLDSVADNSEYWRQRRNIRYRQALLRTKIKNNVTNLQWETVNFLCNNFKTIITTHFETKNMASKEGRNINNKSVRMMLGLSHYAFKQKLLDRAKQRGNQVLIVDESYTSKTCGRCGEIKEDLKGAKMFKCDSCGLKIDRDINGARNIMIRIMSKERSKDCPVKTQAGKDDGLLNEFKRVNHDKSKQTWQKVERN
ncbi:putative transposase [Yasminevirus sp. GU-2018]|uniref:Putative transposase n=1 Tax=Yasminevirus sp. GU-2018 TaxID=2420051 RepID=A0A5K0U8S1_9VIRU|nr:putative transposase [Yasminevirus sp. GU-2018]